MDFKEETKYFVALSQEPKIGARTFLKILKVFPNLEKLWRSSGDNLRKKLPADLVDLIINLKKEINPEEEMRKVDKLGISVIIIKDKNYPRLLKEIPDPPALLYVKGEIKEEDELAVAVVGSRKYSSYGARVAEEIVDGLAEQGITIISGLALGIDTFAHCAALKNKNSRTMAVLACGLDQIYPSSNKHLADQIINGRGAIISEYPIGTPALKYNFPVRNRIIAGLSLGVLVVEAALKSGTFLTAKSALDYNREVLAVPGSIFSANSQGPNNLIQMGAKITTCSDDVLKELNIERKSQEVQARAIIADSKEEEIILEFLDQEKAIHVDKLAKSSKLDIAKVNQTLIMMEMKGKVRNLGANQYVIN